MKEEDLGQPIIWIINSQHWPRALLRAELIERGIDAVGFEEIGQALAAIGDKRTQRPQLIVLELYEQPLRAFDLDNLLYRKIPVIAMAGAANGQEQWVADYPWEAVLRRPFTLGTVCDLVESKLKPPQTHTEKEA